MLKNMNKFVCVFFYSYSKLRERAVLMPVNLKQTKINMIDNRNLITQTKNLHINEPCL